MESVWKENEIIATPEVVEEVKPKEKKIMWGDSVKLTSQKTDQTIEGEAYFPELGDKDAE